MKTKNIFTLTAIAALLVAAVSLNSCSKQDLNEQTPNQQTAGKTEMTSSDIHFYNTIAHFKEKIAFIKEHPDYKSGESMSVDSALWLIESTFNFEYCSPDEKYQTVKADTAFLNIEIGNEGQISLDELSAKYYEMFYAVQDIYSNTLFNDKGLILVKVKLVNLKSSMATIEVGTVTGNRGIDPNPGPFGDLDFWRYGMKEGTCDFEQDTTDAARKIWFKTNDNIPSILPPAGYCFSYSDPVTWTVEGGDEKWRRAGDPEPKNNYLDYYLYYANPTNGTITDQVLCLEPSEMNNYYNWLQNIIYTWLPEEPGMENHVFLIISDFKGIPFGSPVKYKHQGDLDYAIRHLVLCPPPAVPPLED